ncbi:tyrosine-type recombinase/integrase [Bacteroides sp. GD17]|mgnify:FL=1|jgi:site-specific recombinase XerD|uniref:tyrosine-type recombinase/integrase n=1 Tax=Bacteroides sp. GD17 TaxID=3139826 RepID=UPI0025CE4922|nr:site-specific integrase [uncultured Bacteroides sp.]
MKKKTKTELGCSVLLLESFRKLIAQKEKDGYLRTAANYRSTVHKLQAYQPEKSETLTLQEINEKWVSCFVGWLKAQHPNKLQTSDFYFRNVRAMYNGTCKLLKIKPSAKPSPFREVSFAGKQSSKRALTKEEVDKLLDPEFRERLSMHLHESLDILLFMLFMRGMVFQDVFNLTWEMVDADNHIHYLRSKTEIPIDTKIPSEAQKIIEHYRKEDCIYVFPFLHGSKNRRKKKDSAISEQSSLHRVNRHAHKIGRMAGLSLRLSTYVMRHTFATLMLESGKSIELISQCLGHASIRTTQIYISRISMNRVDKEVNDMFDQMLRPITESPPEKIPIREKQKVPPKNKKYPFLHKKGTSSLKHVAKIALLRKTTNFLVSFFSLLLP